MDSDFNNYVSVVVNSECLMTALLLNGIEKCRDGGLNLAAILPLLI